ncbi:hypothetical protein ASPVEDRAFT_820461 [Aspergillus versicolor CBS 583.65]|uniref:Uncharacterized protein n=1 Tax=Aspergillus versicolor CBS 583.65 TaxID=1036611 RepID=A0A1L9PTW4_ASPVE|nr:uncharacterized protein ASPVEDRAFT_820461 [Aspergillus versicolor CBS 583.65]OJJ04865.1 hypothetical protein ASPVEDRAFT_820461 [Aspergillus versicolor CBS 583.65]
MLPCLSFILRVIQTLTRWNGLIPAVLHTCGHDIIHGCCASQPQLPAVDSWDGVFPPGLLESSKARCFISWLHASLFEKARRAVVAMLGIGCNRRSLRKYVCLQEHTPTRHIGGIVTIRLLALISFTPVAVRTRI